MRAWITKHALTHGIMEVIGEEIDHPNNQVCFAYNNGILSCYSYGNDWHKTKELAIARAEEMRILKIKSLDKQLKKISALKF